MPLPRLALFLFSATLALGTTTTVGQDVPPLVPADLIAPTDPLPPEEQQKLFHLPPGFEIQLVAAEPEIRKPMNLAFDARGRLWATQSIEYPYPATGDAPRRDTVRIFDPIAESGRAEGVQVFADGLNIPIGVAPLVAQDGRDEVIVYSIPEIERLRDDDGNDVADTRRKLIGDFGHRDTHGMASSFTPWIDGWMYACHGYSNDSRISAADGREVVMNSGNTYRYRPDGSTVEQFTWGQVNPFGMTFDRWGDVFTSDCHTLPIYLLLRGATYPSFAKPDRGLGFGPAIMSHHHGSTGIAGLVFYDADHFPEEYRGTMFVGNPVTGRINHDHIERYGASARAIEQPDFLWCEDRWFRPVDIQLGPDGAMYIADFYNCIIGHYEVPLDHPRRDRERGRIWRVVYTGEGAGPLRKPIDLVHADDQALIALFDGPNALHRVQAVNELVRRGVSSDLADQLRAACAGDSPLRTIHAIWVLERTVGLADGEIQALFANASPLVRTHAAKLIAEREAWTSLDDLAAAALIDDHAMVRRAAGEAIGRHADARWIAPLLALWESAGDDPMLVHTARVALKNQLQNDAVQAAVSSNPPGNPPLLDQLLDVSLGVRTPANAGFVLEVLEGDQVVDRRPAELFYYAARYTADADVPRAVAAASRRDQSTVPRGRQFAVLQAVRRGLAERGAQVDPLSSWAERLATDLLASDDAGAHRQGLELVRDWRLDSLIERVVEIAANSTDEGVRLAALGSLPRTAATAQAALLLAIMSDADSPLRVRAEAGRLVGANAPSAQLADCLAAAAAAPNLAARAVVEELAARPEAVAELLAAWGEGKLPSDLAFDAAIEQRLLGSGAEAIAERLAAVRASLPEPTSIDESAIARMKEAILAEPGDAEAGKAVFAKNCATCHRLEGVGEKIGPELAGIGARGLDRLLEDVLTPSRNVDANFRASLVLTADGRARKLLRQREEGETVVFVDEQGKEVVIAAGEIELEQPSPLSPMPVGLGETVSPGDFRDLMAYLLTQQQASPAE